MVQAFVGDAFHEDGEALRRTYGTVVLGDNDSYVPASDADEVPSPTCQCVANLREDVNLADSASRRSVAIQNDMYVCYAVKGKLLRVLDRNSGEKLLLRHHEATVLDLTYSMRDCSVLCSVDGGDGQPGKGSVSFWKITRDEGAAIDHTQLGFLSMPASMCVPHATDARVWAVAYGHTAAIVSTGSVDCSSYSAAPLNIDVGADCAILDMAFSSDGTHLVVAKTGAASSVAVYRLPDTDSCVAGVGQLALVHDVAVDGLCGVACFSPHGEGAFVTAAMGEAEGSALPVYVQAWQWGRESTEPAHVQTLTLTLDQEPDSAPDVRLVSDTPDGRFATIFSRGSKRMVCLAIRDALDAPGLPIYHATYLEMGYQVFSAQTSVERDAENMEDILSIAAYQTDFQQKNTSAIQSFAVTLDWLVSDAAAAEAAAAVAASAAAKTTYVPVVDPRTLAMQATVEEVPADASGAADVHQKKMSIFKGGDAGSGNSFLSLLNNGGSPMPSAGGQGTDPFEPINVFAAPAPISEPVSEPVVVPVSVSAPVSKPVSMSQVKHANKSKALKSLLGGLGDGKKETTRDVVKDDARSAAGKRAVHATGPAQEVVPVPVPVSVPVSVPVQVHKETSLVAPEAATSSKKAGKATVNTGVSSENSSSTSDSGVNTAAVISAVTARLDTFERSVLKSVKLAVKTEMKSSTSGMDGVLATEMRRCFEKTLMPGFEAGVAEMLAQAREVISTSSARGAGAKGGAAAAAETAALKAEVVALRGAVAELTGMVRDLASAVASGPRSGTGEGPYSLATENVAAKVARDPMELLASGDVSEALEAVLEEKNIDRVLEVLHRVQEMHAECGEELAFISPLVLLFTAQQLCADMTHSGGKPREGLGDRLKLLKFVVTELLDRHEDLQHSQEAEDMHDFAEFEGNSQMLVTYLVEVLETTEATINKSDPSTRAERTDIKIIKAMVASLKQ